MSGSYDNNSNDRGYEYFGYPSQSKDSSAGYDHSNEFLIEDITASGSLASEPPAIGVSYQQVQSFEHRFSPNTRQHLQEGPQRDLARGQIFTGQFGPREQFTPPHINPSTYIPQQGSQSLPAQSLVSSGRFAPISNIESPERSGPFTPYATHNLAVQMYQEPNREIYTPYQPSFHYDQWQASTQAQFLQTQSQEHPSQDLESRQEFSRSTYPHSHSPSYGDSSPPIHRISSPTNLQIFDEDSTSREVDIEKQLRELLGIPPGVAVNLYAIQDPGPDKKPASLPVLIKLAIYSSPRKQLTLQEMYAALIDRFEWFRSREKERSWKNSIRHNLSLNKVFRIAQRPITEPGKGQYWTVDISEGEGYKRPRKRRPKNSSRSEPSTSAQATSEEEEEFRDTPERSPGRVGSPSAVQVRISTGKGRNPSSHRRSPLASSAYTPYTVSQSMPMSRTPPGQSQTVGATLSEELELSISSAPHSAPASLRRHESFDLLSSGRSAPFK